MTALEAASISDRADVSESWDVGRALRLVSSYAKDGKKSFRYQDGLSDSQVIYLRSLGYEVSPREVGHQISW